MSSSLVRSQFEREDEPTMEESMLAIDALRFKRVELVAQRTTEESENVSIETDVSMDKVGKTKESS